MMLRAYQDRFTWQREWETEKVKLIATVLGAEFKDTDADRRDPPPTKPAPEPKRNEIIETYN